MACVTTIDWGSVADWFSGAASAGAVIVALIVAGRPARDAERERQRSNAEKAERLAHIKAEAILIAGQIEAEARNYARLVALGGGLDGGLQRKELLHAIETGRSQLIALQTLPDLDIHVFAEIGRLATIARLAPDFPQHGSSYTGMVARTLADQLAEARQKMVDTKAVGEGRE